MHLSVLVHVPMLYIFSFRQRITNIKILQGIAIVVQSMWVLHSALESIKLYRITMMCCTESANPLFLFIWPNPENRPTCNFKYTIRKKPYAITVLFQFHH